MRACNGAVQGLVERYLATLFYQCSQIAAFLEGSPVLPLERTGVERKVAAPEVPRKCPARPTRPALNFPMVMFAGTQRRFHVLGSNITL